MDISSFVPKRKPVVKLSLLDKAISWFSPKSGLSRIQSKLAITSLGSAGFITPAKNKRSMIGWNVSGGSADRDSLYDLDASRSGSRDLYMNTPIATGAIRRMRTNVISAGLTLQSRIDGEYLKLSDEQTTQWEKQTERLFKLWSESKDCDLARNNTFKQLQDLAFLSFLMSGDVIALLPYKEVKGFPFKLRVQLIEGDQLSNPNGIENMFDTKIRGGVEVDENGTVIAYHIRSKHPGDVALNYDWKKIPAFGRESGRRNVLHIFKKERPGQRRGMPFLAPVMEQLKQLTRLAESELMAALVASFFTVFIKNIDGDGRLTEGFVPQGTEGATGDDMLVRDSSTTVGDKTYEMGSGNIMSLDANEEIDVADPKRPNDAFEPFFNAILKEIGSAIEVPFEVLLMYFSSNYSASRAELLEAWKTFIMYRINFVTDFCQPIYEEFLTEAVIAGKIIAPDFLTDPLSKLAWCGSRWGGPGQGQIDPMKETKASILKIRNNLSSHEDESQSAGLADWESTAERLRRENDLLTEKGLTSNISTETPDFKKDTEEEEEDMEQ